MNRSVYIGPSRPYGLPLMNRAILMPGANIPGLDRAREDHAPLAKLFVSIEKLAQARQQLATNGSPLQRAYAQVQQESLALRQGGK